MRTQERVNQMNDVITGIARRSAYKFLTKDADELAQELWLHILVKEEEFGYELDLNLIAKMCYDKIVDIQRYDSRRNSISFDQLFERFYASYQHDHRDNEYNEDARDLQPGTFTQPDDIQRIMIEDLINKFPKGSKERLFLEYWGTASGYKDFGIKGNGTYGDGYTESDLAHQLGYAGTSSGGYKSFRNRMRVYIIEFLGD